MDVSRYQDHVLQHALLVKELREHLLQLPVQLLEFGLLLLAEALGCGLLPNIVFVVHLGIEHPNLLDQAPQFPQVRFAVGDLLVHHNTVESFLGRLGQEFLSDGNVLLGRKTEAIDQARDIAFSFLDTLANLDLLLPGEQRHFAHLVHVHPHRVVQNLQSAVLLFLRFGWLGPLHFRVIYDLDIEIAQLHVKVVEVLRRQPVRQNVVDIVVGDMAVLVGQVEQRLDGFSQIHRRGGFAGRMNAMAAGIGGLGLGIGLRLSRAIDGFRCGQLTVALSLM